MLPDKIDNQHPKLSIITVSLNQGRFLRQMIESVLNQSYSNYEHIVVDGGSTDKTIEILKEYPHIKWISEKDDSAAEAFTKATSMLKGEYVIQCCVSDGFLNKDWFRLCVEVLDNNHDVSLVWGLPQYMTEEGNLERITTPEYFCEPPPQKKDFLGFWLATGHVMYEGNQCTRRDVYARCFPPTLQDCRFNGNTQFDFVYNFMTSGYLPNFVPVIANYGRIHSDAQGHSEKMKAMALIAYKGYMKAITEYRNKLFKMQIKHYFRDSASQVISELTKSEIISCRRRFYKTKMKVIANYSIYELMKFVLRKCHLFKLRKWLSSY
ncbi:MAG: glycosyltransferase [Candidatus Omnitrophota bacterium]